MDVRRRILNGVVSGASSDGGGAIDTDNYLTIYARENGLTASLSTNACEYCIDGDGNWLSLAAGATTQSINAGHTLSFRGNLTPSDSYGIGTFTISKKCNLEGNCMSMLFGDNAANNTSLSVKNYAFYKLFYNRTNIIEVSEGFLPATTLGNYCYQYMFYGCSKLTTAPALPATTLAIYCYQYMFSGCTSLTSAPKLPATTLTGYCYYYMFDGCTSLISAPALPATTLASYCYNGMFDGCTSLISAPALPATTLSYYCYNSMFRGCKALTAAPALPATTLARACYFDMFYGCGKLTTAPALPATTLATYCYSGMFKDCTGLTTAPALPATTLADDCYSSMFQNCSKLNYIKMLATDISVTNCLNNWVSGVASIGTFVKNSSMTSLPTGDSGIPSGWTVLDDGSSNTMDNYLTIYALEDGLTASLSTNACEYCIDGDENWKTLSAGTATESINAGHRLSFRGNLTPTSNVGIGTFTINKRCNLEGNCMSMLFGDNAADNTSLINKSYTFYNLFKGCTTVVEVSEGFLPATTLASNCYYSMFRGCTSLTTVPALPATTLAHACYFDMFYGCSSLTTAPELSATTLAGVCYRGMFNGCKSLTTAPELPATTLVINCYQSMFYGCTSLTTAPALPATKLVGDCYMQMFSGCKSLTSAPALPGTTLATQCYREMFYGCIGLTTAPSLPATTLANYCYSYMFSGCTGLTTAPSLPAKWLTYCCYDGMFSGCTGLTTAPSLPATSLAEYCYNGMFSGTNLLPDCSNIDFTSQSVLNSGGLKGLFLGTKVTDNDLNRILPKNSNGKYYLPATTLASGCYSYMFSGCDNLITAPELPATTLADTCYKRMFYQCDNLITGPSLPATTLANSCYEDMFSYCKKLNYIKMLATNISATDCLESWVYDVGSTGTFVKNKLMTSLPTGTSGIPSGWTVQDDYTPTSCTSLTITADDVSGKYTSTTIYYTAVTNGTDTNGNVINNVTITGTATSASFPQNTSTTNTVQRTISYTYLGKTATTTITQGVWVDSQYTVNLNSQWQKSTTISNPDATLYDGVYESFSNYNVNSSAAVMKITIEGYSDFKFYIRSYAESNYDYVIVSQLDQTIDNNTSYSNTTLVKAHTRGNQQSGTALSNYTLVEFTNIDGGKHVITVVYRKDGSAHNGNDRGYVLIPKAPGTSSGGSGGDSGGSGDINNYLTIVALEDGLTASLSIRACEYRIDDGNWLSLAAGATTQSINTGHTLSFRGNLTPSESYGIGTFTINKKCNLEGNCMSMLFGDNAATSTSLSGKDYAFYKLFSGCTNIVEVSDGFLPATTMAYRCYFYMFQGCTSLTTAPALPATTLATECYTYMFNGCTSLTTAPVLPATTLASYCYGNMFSGCSKLTTAPVLPATTLISYCYREMFMGCTSLTTAPVLPANKLTSYCYYLMFYNCSKLNYIKMLATDISVSGCLSNWVNGVASTGTFIKRPSMTSLPTGVSGIPSGWTVVDDGGAN